MKKHFLHAIATGLLCTGFSAPAADLDLYANPSAATPTDLPNVLFIIDNTGNWSASFANEMLALKSVMRNVPTNKFNIGVMLSSETGGGNGGSKGGYLRAAIRPMNEANKAKYDAMFNDLDPLADKSNAGLAGLNMAEAWAYFSGGAPVGGNQKVKADYAGNVSGGAASNAVYALPGNALASKDATSYRSPVVAGSCAKNYIIYISNGPNQESASDDRDGRNLLIAAGGTAAAATIGVSPGASMSNPSDEWARFMKKSALGIVTFTIDVDPIATGTQGPGWTALLKSMSGANNYVSTTSGNGGVGIADAINNALSKIQSVNSVFAAVSLPASANVQGVYLNQLYVGMFRPDENARPRWLGNLKQYKLGSANNLVDALGVDAINTETGFIAECAVSYWTPPKPSAAAPDNYWINAPKSACIPSGEVPDLYANADSPDGNIVEKGAQAYRLRGMAPAARTVKTCATSWSACRTLENFDSAIATTTALGAADTQERDLLIAFAKGSNVDAELAKSTSDMRPSVHGDVIHSNPLALSYGIDVIVFYGSNDGMLHAVNGNRIVNYGSVAPGGELWSFIPPEYFPNVKRLRDNTALVSLTPPVGTARSGSPKPYGIDGPIAAYRENGRTFIYAAMRRGGRAVYAFEVTDPAAPRLLWKSGCASAPATDCTLGAGAIGQTWSIPRPTKVRGYLAGAAPLLIMGGGYDDCEDPDQNTCTSASGGHAVLVLDAASGAVLASLPTDRPVTGDIRTVPDAGGYAKYGYAADLGGNLYRITINNAAPADWTILKIAALGCATTESCSDNRKFMFAPSVIPETDGSYSLYLGSGDREKPLGARTFPHTAAISNVFFKVKDNPGDAAWLSSERANCEGRDLICLASLNSAGAADGSCGASAAPAGKGWTLALRPTEQVVTVAATRYGVTTFSTHMPDVPAPGACGARLGTVHVYNLDIQTAAPVSGTSCAAEVTGGGLPPPPEKMDVCVDTDCSVLRSICIGCSTSSPIESMENGLPPSALGSNHKHRVYWYIQK